ENRLNDTSDIKTIAIDEQNSQTIYQSEESNNLLQYSKAKDLGYVIYTSGTTGLPKGVMVEYHSIVQVLFDKHFNNNTQKSVLWTSYVFDVSIYEMFSSLCFNKQLYIVDSNTKLNPLPYFEYLEFNKIEFAYIPPFYIKELSYYLKDTSIGKLSVILTGVDKIYSRDTTNILNRGIKIINGYGPSETTTCSTKFFIDRLSSEREVVPIGMPLDNEKVYILDNYNQPVPIGVVGELYIGGAGLARGYLNRSELTAERFISNPFATESDISKGYTRLYKTGDLVRWLADGNIEYIGRNDDQVKIRGYRIELGEIENQLSAIEGVKQSCVLAKERNNNKYLIGYYVSDKKLLTQEEILNQLSKVLPEYMIPSALVEIDAMPLTINGKLDRKTLPDPEFINEDRYVAPTTELEEKLC
ncbi:amino acid adenylation domain-containing protein, partial [Francisella sp. SYW-9]|uniref:amino acid adenylation domain-containing protein n=1 Tax=Francisella sp. SYW-9 TaxID=2610888 RepID=UPI00123CE035